ncbi:MAG: MBL fold metallo-hydrolase [Candidatus Andeanibacterium colombiense]|uniref:MBL fold metallo-hydrolase n=1 Tax=Candidatus Andeanibacterium colombiense TaxID=3121345 RepID=A0AAJ6BNH5_9SPHN|nr:MAG: MBL fold metallo-hydrolase [Sphingomonadaceae bacterium]
MTLGRLVLLSSLVLAVPAAALAAEPAAPLFKPWIDGEDPSEPIMQVQQYDPDTFVIRQSVRTNFEAPFLYLLFGKDKALLLDTGAGGLEIRPTIDKLIADWCAKHGRSSIPLVVAHSHGHGDHHAGDAEFTARPDTQVVGLLPTEVAAFFGVTDWPRQIVTFDLGGRPLSIIPTPGHQPAHIVVYDPKTQLLLSGDTLYPGRLYVPANWAGVFRESMDRLAGFVREHPVSHILGAHIEMTTTPGKDYVQAAPVHANEHVLELAPEAAFKVAQVADGMGDSKDPGVTDDFIVFPVPARKPDPAGKELPLVKAAP